MGFTVTSDFLGDFSKDGFYTIGIINTLLLIGYHIAFLPSTYQAVTLEV